MTLHKVKIRTTKDDDGRKQTAIEIDGLEIRYLKDLQINPAVRPDGEPTPVITMSFYAELE